MIMNNFQLKVSICVLAFCLLDVGICNLKFQQLVLTTTLNYGSFLAGHGVDPYYCIFLPLRCEVTDTPLFMHMASNRTEPKLCYGNKPAGNNVVQMMTPAELEINSIILDNQQQSNAL